MDLYKEISLYITTLHPLLRLGNMSLRNIKKTPLVPVESKPSQKDLQKTGIPQTPTFTSKEKIEKIRKTLKQTKSKPLTIPRKNSLPKAKYLQTLISDQVNLKIPQKRKRIKNCPICGCDFPDSFTESELNSHANKCADSQSPSYIDQYLNSLKEIQKDPELNSEEELEKIEKELEQKCPHCNLKIGLRSKAFQDWHILECETETLENLSKCKGDYSELGNIPKKTINSLTQHSNAYKKYF